MEETKQNVILIAEINTTAGIKDVIFMFETENVFLKDVAKEIMSLDVIPMRYPLTIEFQKQNDLVCYPKLGALKEYIIEDYFLPGFKLEGITSCTKEVGDYYNNIVNVMQTLGKEGFEFSDGDEEDDLDLKGWFDKKNGRDVH